MGHAPLHPTHLPPPRRRGAVLCISTLVVNLAGLAGLAGLVSAPSPAAAAAAVPAPPLAPTEADCTFHDFKFASGEVLPELRLHYITLGHPARDAAGVVRNAVLILHGTTGSGSAFLAETFGGKLFGRGQLLDAATHYIVLPDGIGTGKSSRPSEGLHMRFPKYTYDDMVRAQFRLLTECLDVNHLRLVMGTSMGGMHTWVWAYTHPDFMDALMPLASLPVEIAGRNRMLRKMIVDSIESDPEWRQGEYSAQPRGLVSAIHVLLFMVSSPLQWQTEAPTRMQAEALLARLIQRYSSILDANDVIYQFEASRDYDPLPHLGEIRAPLYAVNSADDQINPPELGILDQAIHRVAHGRYILLPITPQTRGHGTHSLPAIWGNYLEELLAASEPPAAAGRGGAR
jgi:homoserine O-acetyltransferase